MSSFSCPHLEMEKSFCLRLKKDCIPGRTGCVLTKDKYQFAVNAEERMNIGKGKVNPLKLAYPRKKK